MVAGRDGRGRGGGGAAAALRRVGSVAAAGEAVAIRRGPAVRRRGRAVGRFAAVVAGNLSRVGWNVPGAGRFARAAGGGGSVAGRGGRAAAPRIPAARRLASRLGCRFLRAAVGALRLQGAGSCAQGLGVAVGMRWLAPGPARLAGGAVWLAGARRCALRASGACRGWEARARAWVSAGHARGTAACVGGGRRRVGSDAPCARRPRLRGPAAGPAYRPSQGLP